MESPAENHAARAPSPLARRNSPVRARRLLVITADPGRSALQAVADKPAPTPQLREAVSAAMKAARRVRRSSPLL